VNRLGPRRIRLEPFRFGRRHGRSGVASSDSSGGRIGHHRGLDMRLAPWAVIDDQHAHYSENGDRNGSRQRRTTATSRMIFHRTIVRHSKNPD